MPSNIYVYLRLLNQQRFVAGMGSAGASVRAFQEEVAAADTVTGKLRASSHLAEGALYAIGSASSLAARGMTGLAAAAGYFGLKFNATMESNQLAFSKFAGSAQAAHKFTMDLFQIAAKTPFSFEDVTTAGRRLLAFGFDVQETTSLLKTMGDTISYTGGSTDEILRLGKALGDIRAKGKLMQQEMNQLANVGIPIRDVLARGGLELTQKQLSNIGRAGIPAEKAISAIQSGLNQMYGGGSRRYLETFNGQLQRLSDNLKMAAGNATSGLFKPLENGLKFINDNMDKVDKFLGGGKFQSILKSIGMVIGGAFLVGKNAVSEFLNAIKPAMPFFQNVLLPILKGIGEAIVLGVVAGFKLFIGIVKIVAPILGFIGKALAPLKPIFEGIGFVIGSIFGPEILDMIAGLGKFGGVFKLIAGAARLALVPFRFFMGVIGKIADEIVYLSREFSFFVQGLGGGIGRAFGQVVKFGAAVRTWFVNVFKNAIHLAASLGQKIAGLGPSIIKFGLKLGDWLFVGIRRTITKLFVGATTFAATIGHGIADWLNAHTPFGDQVNIGPVHFKIPALASGGVITSGGLSLVGEQGPELLRLPAGAHVTPMRPAKARGLGKGDALAAPVGFEGGFHASFHIPVMVGKRQIAEAVGEYHSDRRAIA